MLISHMRRTSGTWLRVLSALIFLSGCGLPTTNDYASPQTGESGSIFASKSAPRRA